MAPRKERPASDEELSAPEGEVGDAGAPMDEVLDLLQHKRAEMHMQGILQLHKLLDRNSEPEFLESRAAELGCALAAAFRKGREDEQATVLQLLCRLMILGGKGGVVLSILAEFPPAFFSSTVATLSSRLSSQVLPYAATAFGLYVLFVSGDSDPDVDIEVVRILCELASRALSSCAGVGEADSPSAPGASEGGDGGEDGEDAEGSGPARDRLSERTGRTGLTGVTGRSIASRTTAARSVTPQIAKRVAQLGDLCEALFCVLSTLALVGRDFLVGFWVSDDQRAELLEQAMALNDPRLSDAVASFVVTLNACEIASARAELESQGESRDWEEELPQTQTQAYFEEVFDGAGAVFGKSISKRSKRSLRDTFSDLTDELQSGKYKGETVQLKTRESLRISTRDMANRYALVSTVLGESLHLATAGNVSVRAFLELPDPQSCHVLVNGAYAGEKSIREERAGRAAARREKEQKRREK